VKVIILSIHRFTLTRSTLWRRIGRGRVATLLKEGAVAELELALRDVLLTTYPGQDMRTKFLADDDMAK
jgi:hypothetical protein